MKNCNGTKNQTRRRILPIACANALAVVFAVPLVQSAPGDRVTPPPVPFNLEVPAGNEAFLEGHGVAAPRTMSACPQPPQPLASPTHSSRRKTRCSTTMVSNSSPCLA